MRRAVWDLTRKQWTAVERYSVKQMAISVVLCKKFVIYVLTFVRHTLVKNRKISVMTADEGCACAPVIGAVLFDSACMISDIIGFAYWWFFFLVLLPAGPESNNGLWYYMFCLARVTTVGCAERWVGLNQKPLYNRPVL